MYSDHPETGAARQENQLHDRDTVAFLEFVATIKRLSGVNLIFPLPEVEVVKVA